MSSVMLILSALERKDAGLVRGLFDLAKVPQQDGAPIGMTDADCAPLYRLRVVCEDKMEVAAWGRALLHACMRGDRRQVDGLLELAARRCAS